MALIEGADARFWLGFDGAGLGRLDPATGQLETWGAEVLGHGVVSALDLDGDGVLTAATLGAGVLRRAPGADVFEALTVADGLSSNAVKAMTRDASGVLWLAGEVQLDRFDPAAGSIRAFGVSDGVPPMGFVPKAAAGSRERLWFGAKNGLVSLRPAELEREIPPPPAVFTWLEVMHRRVEPGGGDAGSTLDRAIQRTEAITLAHDDRIVAVGFTAKDLGTPESHHFRYRLVGFDRDWVVTDGASPFARYSNLPAGLFTLRVEASLDEESWGAPAMLRIRVKPPWWLSPVAKLTYFALTLLSLGLVFEKQRRQVKTLGGLLPICAACKRIRDDEGYWQEVEAYVSSRSTANFSHGLCPSCLDQSLKEIDEPMA